MLAARFALSAWCWCFAFGVASVGPVGDIISDASGEQLDVATVGSANDAQSDTVQLMQLAMHSSGPLEAQAPECDWTVHYNRWIPSPSFGREFDVAYAHGGHIGGADHCLKVCCRDPTCKGLSLRSDFSEQCYKYDKVPDGLGDSGEPLSMFTVGGNSRKAEWSIFVKSVRDASHDVGLVNREGDLDERLAGLAQGALEAVATSLTSSSCEWDVHYDRWLPSFKSGEYFHAAAGSHCLDLCCNDPSCTGIATDAWEAMQCYKYDAWPVGLDHGDGRRLGNGKWLLHEREAWSIFLKVEAGAKASQQRQAVPVALAPALSVLALAVLVLVRRYCSRDSHGKCDQSEMRPLAVRAR